MPVFGPIHPVVCGEEEVPCSVFWRRAPGPALRCSPAPHMCRRDGFSPLGSRPCQAPGSLRRTSARCILTHAVRGRIEWLCSGAFPPSHHPGTSQTQRGSVNGKLRKQRWHTNVPCMPIASGWLRLPENSEKPSEDTGRNHLEPLAMSAHDKRGGWGGTCHLYNSP